MEEKYSFVGSVEKKLKKMKLTKITARYAGTIRLKRFSK
jgi:hypothetical protein